MRVVRRRCVATSFSAEAAERIIVALDGMAPDQALAFSAQVEGLRWVKVGLELFVQAGPEVVAQLRSRACGCFWISNFTTSRPRWRALAGGRRRWGRS